MILLWLLVAILLMFGLTVFIGAPYVPTKKGDVRRAFKDLYVLTEGDTLLDIGSGDGVVLRIAAESGAKAIGYEINPILVVISQWLSRGNPRVSTQLKNFWRSDFPPNTTVVYVFGESRDIARMARRIQNQVNKFDQSMYLISYGFKVPGIKELASNNSHHLYSFVPDAKAEIK